jgi:hypothetical protein
MPARTTELEHPPVNNTNSMAVYVILKSFGSALS